MELQIDSEISTLLQKNNIYQARTGMVRKYEEPRNRWVEGTIITFEKDTYIEEFTTFAAGNSLFSCGMFSAIASDIGSNVKIGSGVYLSGPVTIENGAEIGDDTLLFSTGHSLLAKERRVGFSLKHLMYEYSVSKPIVVKQNANVGAHTVIVPGSVVTGQVPENSIFVKNKVI